MERDEMRKILEEIARESPNPTARVSAIRALKQLNEDEEKESNKSEVSAGWEELYAVRPRKPRALYRWRGRRVRSVRLPDGHTATGRLLAVKLDAWATSDTAASSSGGPADRRETHRRARAAT
jgi:hypothetical protein